MTEHAILTFARYRRFQVTHPDGTDVRLEYTGKSAEPDGYNVSPYARAAWSQKNPTWNWDACRPWCKEATVTEARDWEVAWCDGNGWQRLDAELGAWHWGVPAQGIVTLLDRYTTEGWAVAHVSEDHGVYMGADVPEESYITRIRYLLIRTQNAPRPSDAVSSLV